MPGLLDDLMAMFQGQQQPQQWTQQPSALDWRQLSPLTPLVGQQPAAQFNPMAAPSSWNMPTPFFSIESQRHGEGPKVGGGMNLPAMGGQVGLQGSYFKPDRFSPAEWSAMLNFRKPF